MYVVITNPVEGSNGGDYGKISSTSASTGSKTTASFTRAGWAIVAPTSIPKDDDGNPQWVVTQYNSIIGSNPTAKIYSRTGSNTGSVTSGPSGMPTSSASSAVVEYMISTCAPGTSGSGCNTFGTGTNNSDNITATQNGVAVTEQTVQPGIVNIKGGYVEKPYGANENLQHVSVGRYVSQDLNFNVTATRTNAAQEQLPNGMFFDPQGTGLRKEGYFFTGTETPAADMVGLSTGANPVTARYTGIFNGNEITDTSGRGIYGQTDLTANFGAGTVAGSVHTIRPEVNCSGNCATAAPLGYNLDVNAKITGSQYAGTATFANGTSGPPTGAATGVSGTGSVVGGFFGPQAAETAGALRVNGAAPGISGTNTTVIGGFGGRKQ